MTVLRPLSDLPAVGWSELEHSHGSAEDVPEMLRALQSEDPDTRDGARAALHASLDHQGVQRFEATLRAVPFLIGLIADPDVPERGAIARLLAELAVGDTCWFLHDGFHPDHQVTCDGAARPQACAEMHGGSFATRGFPELDEGRLDMSPDSGLRLIYDAVMAGVPTYVAALADGDEELRGALPFLLAFLTPDAARSAGALHWLIDDLAETVRASAMLGLSHATRFSVALSDDAFATLSGRWDRELGDLERRCLALALVRYQRPVRTAAARAYLRDCLENGVPGVLPDDRFPWFRIDSPPFVYATTWRGTAESERAALLRPARECLRLLDNPHDAADLAVWIAVHHIPELHRPLDRRRIDVELRATLTSLAGSKAAWRYSDLANCLEARGLPTDRTSLIAWLSPVVVPPPPPARRKPAAARKKPPAKKPVAKKPVAKKPAAKKPAAKKKVAKKPAKKKPAPRARGTGKKRTR